jgi:hypothetical protein
MTLDERLALLMRVAQSFRMQACLEALRKLAEYYEYEQPSENKQDPAVIFKMLEEKLK